MPADRFLKQLINEINSIFQCDHETKSMVCNLSFFRFEVIFQQAIKYCVSNRQNHVCLLNRKHLVDRLALRLIHWIGQSVLRKCCHMLNNVNHIL